MLSSESFQYETHQTLPAQLTDEELAAVRLIAQAAGSALKGLGWIAAALAHGLVALGAWFTPSA